MSEPSIKENINSTIQYMNYKIKNLRHAFLYRSAMKTKRELQSISKSEKTRLKDAIKGTCRNILLCYA